MNVNERFHKTVAEAFRDIGIMTVTASRDKKVLHGITVNARAKQRPVASANALRR